ncbi:hypothetical protein [Streptomyces canus]|uniref:hypothetical protein n=1 Tax=Streptomyces canus TaxID=58343 RepID=UPI003F6CB4F9
MLLESAGYTELIGRATWQHSFGPEGLNGYYLRVSDTGAWSILRNNTDNNVVTLAGGTVAALGTNSWHNLRLGFYGNTVTAWIDGVKVGSVNDSTYAEGQAGYGNSQGETGQFGNLSIGSTTKVAGVARAAASTCRATTRPTAPCRNCGTATAAATSSGPSTPTAPSWASSPDSASMRSAEAPPTPPGCSSIHATAIRTSGGRGPDPSRRTGAPRLRRHQPGREHLAASGARSPAWRNQAGPGGWMCVTRWCRQCRSG